MEYAVFIGILDVDGFLFGVKGAEERVCNPFEYQVTSTIVYLVAGFARRVAVCYLRRTKN